MVILSSGPTSETGLSGGSVGATVRQIFLTGAAVTIPLVVTVMILVFVINFILQAITPVVAFVDSAFGIGQNVDPLVMKLLAILTFVLMVFVVGLVAEARSGDGLERVFDTAMARIPGIGSLYTSFNEMAELLLSNDAQSFREVKLVEFPREGSYSLAFVTAESPPTIGEATGNDDVTTLFMPLAPNPVMGGYVIHVSADRVYDVDLTVEEGIRSIVTSGVATGETDAADDQTDLVDMATIRKQARDGVADIGAWGTQTVDDLSGITDGTAEEIRRELSNVRPDLYKDVDEGEAVRHYTLDRTARDRVDTTGERAGNADGESGADSQGENGAGGEDA